MYHRYIRASSHRKYPTRQYKNKTRVIPCAQTSLVPQDHSHSSHRRQQASEDLYKPSQAFCHTELDQKITGEHI